jgi:hypothetical protein
MASLAQFLALLSNEIRRGKMLVDLDTARQSTQFLRDEFLRLIPITRIEVDSVRLNFKMAVSELATGSVETSPFLAALGEKLGPEVAAATARLKEGSRISPDAVIPAIVESAALALIPALPELDPSRIESIGQGLATQFSQYFLQRFLHLVAGVPEAVRTKVRGIAERGFAENFKQHAERYKFDLAAQLLRELGGIDVVVEAEKLRTFPPDALVGLELHLSPRTFHWSLKAEYANKPDMPPEDRYTLIPG